MHLVVKWSIAYDKISIFIYKLKWKENNNAYKSKIKIQKHFNINKSAGYHELYRHWKDVVNWKIHLIHAQNRNPIIYI